MKVTTTGTVAAVEGDRVHLDHGVWLRIGEGVDTSPLYSDNRMRARAVFTLEDGVVVDIKEANR